MTSQTLPTRDRLDRAETWALEHVFATRADYDAAMADAERRVRALTAYRDRIGADAGTLHAFLDELSRTTALVSRLRLYATLPSNTDQSDDAARRLRSAFTAAASRWEAETAFVRPELLAIERERLAAFREELPALERFSPFLARLEEERPFVRSGEVEDVLALAQQPFAQVFDARQSLVAGDMRFESVRVDGEELEVAPSTVRGLEADGRREVRRQAFASFADAHLAFEDTLGELYLARVQQQAFDARVRGHESGEAASLAAMHVPTSVLDATIQAFRARIGVWHRYWEVRRRLVGVERLEPWDVFAPLQPDPPRVSVSQAADWIVASAAPLGEAYSSRLREGLHEERWVDLRPCRGKREGAFCEAAPDTHPYVMMSYVDDLQSASTLAHELGHAMHFELFHRTQDPLDGIDELGMTVAETASNAQQALLRSFLLQGPAKGDERFELAVLDEAMYNFHRYFFVMPTLVRFEREVHAAVWRGDALTGADLTRSMRDLFQEGYGETVEADERVGITWAQFGHLFVPFYTFQYAVGIAAASTLVARIAAGEEGAAAAFRAFMEAGSATPPVELFASVGLDVATPEPVDHAFDVVEGYVARLEELALR